jgi:hypothetical protein
VNEFIAPWARDNEIDVLYDRHRDSEGDLLPKVLKTPLSVGYHLREDTLKQDSSNTEETASSKGDEIKTDESHQPSDEAGNSKVRERAVSTQCG